MSTALHELARDLRGLAAMTTKDERHLLLRAVTALEQAADAANELDLVPGDEASNEFYGRQARYHVWRARAMLVAGAGGGDSE